MSILYLPPAHANNSTHHLASAFSWPWDDGSDTDYIPIRTPGYNNFVLLTVTNVTWNDIQYDNPRHYDFIRWASRGAVGNLVTARNGHLLCPIEALTAVGSGDLGTVIPPILSYEQAELNQQEQDKTSHGNDTAVEQDASAPAVDTTKTTDALTDTKDPLEEAKQAAKDAITQRNQSLSENIDASTHCPTLKALSNTQSLHLLELQKTAPAIQGFDSHRLGAVLLAEKRTVASIGRGAAVITSDSSGRLVGDYSEAPTDNDKLAKLVAKTASVKDFTAVDADVATMNASDKIARISHILHELPPSTQVIIASVSSGYDARLDTTEIPALLSNDPDVSQSSQRSAQTRPPSRGRGSLKAMQLIVVSTDSVATGYLRSGTMNRQGVVTLADIAPTIASAVYAPNISSVYGTRMWSTGYAPGAPTTLDLPSASTQPAISQLHQRTTFLTEADQHFITTSHTYRIFYTLLLILTIVTLLILLGTLHRRNSRPRLQLPLTTLVGSFALLPACTLIINTIGWSETSLAFDSLATRGLVMLGASWFTAFFLMAALFSGFYLWNRSTSQRRQSSTTALPNSHVIVMLIAALNLAITLIFLLFFSNRSIDAVLRTPIISTTRFNGLSAGQFGVIAVSLLSFIHLLFLYSLKKGLWTLTVLTAVGAYTTAWICGSPQWGNEVLGSVALTIGITLILFSHLLPIVRYKRSTRLILTCLAIIFTTALFGVALIVANIAVPLQARSPLVKAFAQILSSDGPLNRSSLTYVNDMFYWTTNVWSNSLITICCLLLIIFLLIVFRHTYAHTSSSSLKKPRPITTIKRHHLPFIFGVVVSAIIAMSVNSEAPIIALLIVFMLVSVITILIIMKPGDVPDSSTQAQLNAMRHISARRKIRTLAAITLVIAISVITLMQGVNYARDTQALRASLTPAPHETLHNDSAHTHSRPTPSVIVVTSGLTWDHLRYADLPAVKRHTSKGAAFNIIPQTLSGVTCPVDDWLAINTGRKVWDRSLGGMDLCMQMPQLKPGSKIPLWNYYKQAMAQISKTDSLGSLGDALKKAGLRVATIGPGAALATATSQGIPYGDVIAAPHDIDNFRKLINDTANAHDLTIVDATTVDPSSDPFRQTEAMLRSSHEIRKVAAEKGLDTAGVVVEPVSVRARLNALNPDAIDQNEESAKLEKQAARSINEQKLADSKETAQSLGFPDFEPPVPLSSVYKNKRSTEDQTKQARRFDIAISAVPKEANLLAISPSPLGIERKMLAGLASGPDIPAGDSWSSLVHHKNLTHPLDIGPTIASWMGLPDSALSSAQGSALGFAPYTKTPRTHDSALNISTTTANTEDASSVNTSQNTPEHSIGVSNIKPHNSSAGTTETSTQDVEDHLKPSLFDIRAADLVDRNLHSKTIQSVRSTFFHVQQSLFYALVIIFFVGTSAIFWRRTTLRSNYHGMSVLIPHIPYVVAQIARFLTLTLASAPLGTHLMALLPWWHTLMPEVTMIGGAWAIAVLVASVALAGPWGRALMGPFVLIAALYAVFFTFDVAVGSPLLMDSPMGFNLLLGVRFMGAGNESYTIFATGTLIFLAFLGEAIVQKGSLAPTPWQTTNNDITRTHKIASAAVILLLGSAVTLVDVHPSMGADFGGALSLIPGLLVLVLMILRYRITVKKTIIIATLTVGAAMSVAIADWMRPSSQQTHLGRFVQSIIDGNLVSVLYAKLSVNLSLLTSSRYTMIFTVGLVCVFLLLPALRGKHMDDDYLSAWWRIYGPLRFDKATGRRFLGPLQTSIQLSIASLRLWYWRCYGWMYPLHPQGVQNTTGTIVNTEEATSHLQDTSCTRSNNAVPRPQTLLQAATMLRPMFISVAVMEFFGFALNDSGIVLPAIATMVYLPAFVAVIITWLMRQYSSAPVSVVSSPRCS
ncbi:MAG: hypothetical protein Q4P66_01265 [Actinomycetaceae bacterium]|nr:hypothetical protein [Actinomycetaceae bacterium]